jgi:probable HAF family extracellular repeat protein
MKSPTKPRIRRYLPVLVACCALTTPSLIAATLTPLGYLPGDSFYSRPYGVSADGTVVVGYSSSAIGTEAFRWNGGTMTGLGGSYTAIAYGISSDGNTVAGAGYSANGTEAFRLTGGILTGLGDLPGGRFDSIALGISADGYTVAGVSDSVNGTEAFRWNGGTMTGLGDLPGGGFESMAYGVSADGSTVVGYGSSANGTEAFRWNGGTMTALGYLPGGSTFSYAYGVSADGSVVVGQSFSASGFQAFRWNGVAMSGLGDLPGGSFYSAALGVSADGNTVVGYGWNSADTQEATVWRQDDGMQSLFSLLLDAGFDSAGDGWSRLSSATGVSADGRYVIGYGLHNGNEEAFLADLAPAAAAPEAGTWAAIAAVSLAGLWQWRYRLFNDNYSSPLATIKIPRLGWGVWSPGWWSGGR